jgi:hypothetical protein
MRNQFGARFQIDFFWEPFPPIYKMESSPRPTTTFSLEMPREIYTKKDIEECLKKRDKYEVKNWAIESDVTDFKNEIIDIEYNLYNFHWPKYNQCRDDPHACIENHNLIIVSQTRIEMIEDEINELMSLRNQVLSKFNLYNNIVNDNYGLLEEETGKS